MNAQVNAAASDAEYSQAIADIKQASAEFCRTFPSQAAFDALARHKAADARLDAIVKRRYAALARCGAGA